MITFKIRNFGMPFSFALILVAFFIASPLLAVSPSEMAVFQRGPVGYGQAYLKRFRAAAETHAMVTTKSGREDASLTELTGDTKENTIDGAGYLQLSETFYLLFSAQLFDYSKRYETSNKIYSLNSDGVNYSIESGAHIEKGHINYGSKIGLRIFGEESRVIDDPTSTLNLKIPEAQVPYLKFWAALKDENSQIGLTVQLQNKMRVKPKSSDSGLATDRYFARSVPGMVMLDLKMRHSEAVTFAFGAHLVKREQTSESIQDASNILTGEDRYQSYDSDQYSLLVGSELQIRPEVALYSSYTYYFDAFQKEGYASVIQDNIGGSQLASSLLIGPAENEFGLGLTYRLAKAVKTVVPSNSSIKPWAGSGNGVYISQSLWRITLSWKSHI
ncbi:hypothetical protein N9D31_01020 [Oligoflexaceae bacterium]|nr:hypothetical protein [Oligoflexaceae bacterium]